MTILAGLDDNGKIKKDMDPNTGNVNIAGSYVQAKTGAVNLLAGNDITIGATIERNETYQEQQTRSEGFFSTTTTETRDWNLINQVKGSTISGNTINMNAGKDLTIAASNVIGTGDVKLDAGNNVIITSAAETGNDEHYRYEKTSGIFGNGGLGFTIGSKSEKSDLKEQTIDQVGSTIGSVDGNVTVTAGNKVQSSGTTFIAGGDLAITGKDVTIDNTLNLYDSQYTYEFKQSGLSVSLGGSLIDKAAAVVS